MTGGGDEYAQLKDRTITPEVASTIDRWLKNHQ
jgi:hypothetical protein